MVDAPEAYRWSSYAGRMGLTDATGLDLDPMYLALGEDEAGRRERYLAYLNDAIPEGEWQLIREAVKRGQLTGGPCLELGVRSHILQHLQSGPCPSSRHAKCGAFRHSVLSELIGAMKPPAHSH